MIDKIYEKHIKIGCGDDLWWWNLVVELILSVFIRSMEQRFIKVMYEKKLYNAEKV